MRVSLAIFAAWIMAMSVVLVGVPTAQAAPNNSGMTMTVNADETIIPPGNPVTITEGHIDIGPRIIDNKLVLLFRDDTVVPPVWRYLDDAVFVLGDAAANTLPEGHDYDFTGATGGDTVWAVPQNQVAGVPWIGWTTQDPGVAEVFTRGVNFSFGPHHGDGQASMFLQSGGFGGPQVLFNSAQQTSQSIFVDLHTHTHLNWVFNSPGAHVVEVAVSGETPTGEQASATGALVFAVGQSNEAAARSLTRASHAADLSALGNNLTAAASDSADPAGQVSSTPTNQDVAPAAEQSPAADSPQESTGLTAQVPNPNVPPAAQDDSRSVAPAASTANPSGVSTTVWLLFAGLMLIAVALLAAALLVKRRRAADAVLTGGDSA